jgi:hypothetical protein
VVMRSLASMRSTIPTISPPVERAKNWPFGTTRSMTSVCAQRVAGKTRTVGRGTCSECWHAKTPEGEPALRPVAPKTLPLLGSIDDVPNWVWFALAAALVGGLLKGLAFAL